jgi:hypothetical protein
MSSIVSRCYTVRPTAAAREGFSVLVIDRSTDDAESLCAILRDEGHAVETRCYGDALEAAVDELSPQVIAIRMRAGGAARATQARIEAAFPHLRVVTFNASTSYAVKKLMPKHWTDLCDLSAARMPRPAGFPRAVREVLEELLSA